MFSITQRTWIMFELNWQFDSVYFLSLSFVLQNVLEAMY